MMLDDDGGCGAAAVHEEQQDMCCPAGSACRENAESFLKVAMCHPLTVCAYSSPCSRVAKITFQSGRSSPWARRVRVILPAAVVWDSFASRLSSEAGSAQTPTQWLSLQAAAVYGLPAPSRRLPCVACLTLRGITLRLLARIYAWQK